MESQRETAVLVATDMHYGKLTATFNPQSFRRRTSALGEKLKRLREFLSNYEFDELVIACLGDVNDGTDIYATQPYHQAIVNVEQQAEGWAGIMREFSLRQADVWGRVRWECVPGNHGRGGRRVAEAANWDIVAYRYLRLMLNDGRIVVNMPPADGDPFLRVMKIYQHGYLIYHGHEIRAWGSIPWYGILLRLLRWNAAMSGWNVALMGHFHTLGFWRFNRITVLCSGTMVTDDDWSLRMFGWEPAAQWWLFGVSPKRAVTWQFPVELE